MLPSRAEAVRAAVEVAAAHGLDCPEPEVLADGFNVVVHLRPAPVVARVVLVPALLRDDPAGMISRELRVTGFLAERGVPAVRPGTELPPGPHERRGLWLSFWEYLEVHSGHPGPAEFGAHLRELHGALRDHPAEGAALDVAVSDVGAFLDRGGKYVDVAEQDTKLIASEFDRVRPEIPNGGQQLHGDAHPGNLVPTPRGWVWTDFEETTSGPLGWDLACAHGTTRLDGNRALREYGAEPGTFEPFGTLRTLQAACWLLLMDVRFPGYRQRGLEMLDRLR